MRLPCTTHILTVENMKFIKSIGIALLGIVIVVLGFIYDVLFAGIPYQDPTPELQARYDFHSSVAEIFYTTGGIVFWAGLVAIPFIWNMATSRSSGCPDLVPLKASLKREEKKGCQG